MTDRQEDCVNHRAGRPLKGLGTRDRACRGWSRSPFAPRRRPRAAAAAGPPRRLAFLYVPNGVNMADWTPSTATASSAS